MPWWWPAKEAENVALDSGFDDRSSRIEIIPLMDVVFLLLVYFIYAMFSMTIHRGVRVNLPSAAGATELGERIMLTLTADNELQLNGVATTLEQGVADAIELWRRQGHPVIISADRKADIGPGIEILAKLKKAGVESVAFQVQHPIQESANQPAP